MTTIDVKDAGGQTVAVEKPLTPGRASAAQSRPVVLSDEDLAALTAISDALGGAGLAQYVDTLETLGGATNTLLTALNALITTQAGYLDGVEGKLDTIGNKDFATQTTLAAILAKLIAAPATEAKQDTGNTSLSTIAGKDFATQTTLAALLAKVIAAPATEAKQDSAITQETAINTVLGVKGDAKSTATDTTAVSAMSVWKQISASVQTLGTQTTLAAILAKIIAAPATEAKQDTGNTSLSTIAGKDFATQTTLAAILAKIIAAPATEAKQDAAITQETAINTVLGVKGDAKSTATDTTAITAMQVWKQISASVQAIATSIASLVTGTVLAAGTAIIGKVGIDQTTPGTTNRVTVGASTVIDVTLSLDTSAYASGDVLADTQQVSNALRVADFGGVLQSVTLIDKDDQGVALDLYIFDANVAMGTENSAPSISDANAASILGRIQIGAGDYYDLGGCKVAHLSGLAIPVKPVSGTRDLYIAAVNGTGTPTFTASGVVVRLGILQD